MAGIIHLRYLYENEGMEFINDLLRKEVYITEKIDGARFAFERKGNELVYYKRDSSKPISMIDRTVMRYYENAIAHAESIDIKLIPENHRFGFEYFTNNSPGTISYDIIPENGLILTDITAESIINEVEELNRYAKLFKVSPPPIIHTGTLSESQRNRIIEFLQEDWDTLVSRFKNESFTNYVFSIFNPTLESTALNTDTQKPIEGVVISFIDEGVHTNAKVVNPLYTETARTFTRNRFDVSISESNQIFREFISDVISHMKEHQFDIKPKFKCNELRYVETLSEIFYHYYTKKPHAFESIPPARIPKDEMDINYNHISNKKLESVLKSNNRVKTAYTKYLPAFASKRTRGNNILKKEMVEDINHLIPQLRKLSLINSDTMMENMLKRIINILSDS